MFLITIDGTIHHTYFLNRHSYFCSTSYSRLNYIGHTGSLEFDFSILFFTFTLLTFGSRSPSFFLDKVLGLIVS